MFDDKLPQSEFGQLPHVMRVLEITSQHGSRSWLEKCLADDSAMAVKLESVPLDAAITLLRQQVYDSVIIQDGPNFDAIKALAPLRTASPDHLAIVVIGDKPAADMTALCLDSSADAYVCRNSTDVRTLLWTLARAAERQGLIREAAENRTVIEQQKALQHQLAVHQLRTQRSLLLEHAGLESLDPNPPDWLVEEFLELLRISVVSGTGTMRDEVSQLVTKLDRCQVTLAEAMMAHTLAAEKLVLGLANRPAWHILGRANLLIYEVVMQLQQTTV